MYECTIMVIQFWDLYCNVKIDDGSLQMGIFKRGLLLILFILVMLSGCSNSVVENADQYVSSIEQITLPDGVRVIGLGEATHGNIEFQQLKKDVFEALITNEDVYVFVLEGDFGSSQIINHFILTGEGTAKDAVNALDYPIYRTEQMIKFVQWMHDYNRKANADKKITFYGNDMQRYDYSKEGLLDYYEVVNPEAANALTEQLNYVSNDTMRTLTAAQLQEVNDIMDNIKLDLQSNKEIYVQQSSPDDFAIALQYMEIIRQRTELLLTDDKHYARVRDQYLADNLQWIIDYEETRGHDKILISAHNGHIEKTSASLAGYKSMGNYLAERYGEEYFAIGTEFMDNTFQALNGGSDEREQFTVKHHSQLTDAFGDIESNEFYVDFKTASQSAELSKIIHSEQRMGNIGDDFRAWYKIAKMFYTIKMKPFDAYDGLIIVKESKPTTVLE